MNIALWIIQILLSGFFLMTGYSKLAGSKEAHIADGHIKPGSAIWPIRVLGFFEILGCVGIILPWLIGVMPVLTPVSAICFCLIMCGALVVHFRKKEYKFLPLPVLIILLAGFVAYHRFEAYLTK